MEWGRILMPACVPMSLCFQRPRRAPHPALALAAGVASLLIAGCGGDSGFDSSTTGFDPNPITISGVIIDDCDGDGVLDNDPPFVEGGLPDIGIGLFVIDSTGGTGPLVANPGKNPGKSDATGAYALEFDDLPAGDYRLIVNTGSLPPGYVESPPCSDVAPCDKLVQVCCSSFDVAIPEGENPPAVDFGFAPQNGSIGGFVWYDKDDNGEFDPPSEVGMNGVFVRLCLLDGTVLLIDQTGPDGLYQFDGLATGSYMVDLVVPTGLRPTFCGQKVAAVCPPVEVDLPTGKATDTVDFALTLDTGPGKIGDLVFYDELALGTQNGDAGILEVDVLLFDEFQNELRRDTTEAASLPATTKSYLFENLPVRKYFVSVDPDTVPKGLVPTPLCEVGDPATDSNCIPAFVDLTALPVPEDLTIDFGFVNPCNGQPGEGEIGNFVWHDRDCDGIQDPGEPGLQGVRLNLLDQNMVVCDIVESASDGSYRFPQRCAGTYFVEVDEDTLPMGFVEGPCNVGTNDALDNDCSGVMVTLPADDSVDDTIDFGFCSVGTAEIGDFVFRDKRCNGKQGPFDKGISGVVVRLKNNAGLLVQTDTTDSGGLYRFTGIAPGDYVIEVDGSTLPAGFTPAPPDVGSDDTIDSELSPHSITVQDGEINLTYDFGYCPPMDCDAELGDFVFRDVDEDGIQDYGEPGIEFVRLVLRDDQLQQIDEAWTDEDGEYRFEDVCVGTYTIEVDVTTLPPGAIPSPCDQPGFDPEKDSNCSPATVVVDDPMLVDHSIDFGYIVDCAGRIGNFVWDDRDGDGLQDPGEAGIQGIVLVLRNASGSIIATETSDSNGWYEFDGLCSGNYILEFDPASVPSGMEPSPCDVGTDDTIDSDCSPVALFLPTDDEREKTFDFGFTEDDDDDD